VTAGMSFPVAGCLRNDLLWNSMATSNDLLLRLRITCYAGAQTICYGSLMACSMWEKLSREQRANFEDVAVQNRFFLPP
jgi:hypothetical protein